MAITDPTRRAIDRHEALLWLNDRLGRQMSLTLRRSTDRGSFGVLSVTGELDHWSSSIGPIPGDDGELVREQLIGLYVIGGCNFDISAPGAAVAFSLRERGTVSGQPLDSELIITLADEIELGIMPPVASVPDGVISG
jgi:hypothetical protein